MGSSSVRFREISAVFTALRENIMDSSSVVQFRKISTVFTALRETLWTLRPYGLGGSAVMPPD